MKRIEARSGFLTAVKRHKAAMEAAFGTVEPMATAPVVDLALQEARLRSLFFLNTSGIPELMDRFAGIVDGQNVRGWECLSRRPEIEEDEGSSREAVELTWPVSNKSALLISVWDPEGGDDYFESKGIVVEAMTEGGVIIHGDEHFGTTFLDLKDWKRKPVLIDRALEKAYHTPRVLSCGREEDSLFVYGDTSFRA